jgi:hypothetical protein
MNKAATINARTGASDSAVCHASGVQHVSKRRGHGESSPMVTDRGPRITISRSVVVASLSQQVVARRVGT